MIEPPKTIFISYRRAVGKYMARAVFENLRGYGYDVFLDYENIHSGDFARVILQQIAARFHFLVILTPGALDRCADPDDWLRREIDYAMQTRRNIVPLLFDNFSFGDNPQALVGSLAHLSRYNGLTVPYEYFDEAMRRLRTRFLREPKFNVEITPLSSEEQGVVSQKITQAASFDRQEALTHIVLGLELSERGQYDEAMTHLMLAARLAPQLVSLYEVLGSVRYEHGDLEGAIGDYQKYLDLGGGETYGDRIRIEQRIETIVLELYRRRQNKRPPSMV